MFVLKVAESFMRFRLADCFAALLLHAVKECAARFAHLQRRLVSFKGGCGCEGKKMQKEYILYLDRWWVERTISEIAGRTFDFVFRDFCLDP